MRFIAVSIPLLILGFVLPRTVPAQESTSAAERPSGPPTYRPLRFDEDYSYLADPSMRRDGLDDLKYLPLLADDAAWRLTLGGELRERFEAAHNGGFGVSSSKDEAYWLQRVTLLADLHLGDRVRFFVEGISGLMEGQSGRRPPVQQDPVDLQFAFVDVVPFEDGDEKLTLRAGRFGMSLGTGRLLATRAAPNIPFRFDGAEAIYTQRQWSLTMFATEPVKDSGHFDGEDHSTKFWGLYLTHWLDDQSATGFDLYYLGIQDHGTYASGTALETRHSLGAREFGHLNRWDWNAEEVLQFGSFGNDSILAWTASLDTGYTWDVPLHPRLGMKMDVTSGDRNANDGRQGTFDALFFKSGYFNDASLIRPENIIDIHPNLGVKLTSTLSADGGVDAFWRYSRNDAVYAVPGFIGLPASRSNSSYVGTAFDLNLQWKIREHVTFEASYVHFLTGSYVRQSGGGSVNYVSATLSFLF